MTAPVIAINATVLAKKPARAVLTRDLVRDLKRGHPWVFADAIRLPGGIAAGDLVTVAARDHKVVGLGYADPEGPLAVRMLTTDARAGASEVADLIGARLAAALELRRSLFDERVTGMRLVNGEGDGLPGLVIDRYGRVAVIKTDGPIAEAFWDVDGIARWVHDAGHATSVYLRTRSRGGAEGRALIGEAPGVTSFREGPATLHVDVVSGQKTGFFLDQREHRLRVGALAKGRRVLNVFGYTGGFSIHAGLGGASDVTTVDLAAPAIAQAERSWAANGLAKELHRALTADAFAFLEAAAGQTSWDLVVLDPPAFAASKKAVPQALTAYRRLTALGAKVTAPDGLLLIASCSAHVSQAELLSAIEDGIGDTRRRADVLAIGGQPPDHPWPLACPELAYLKVVYLRVR